MSYQKEKPMNLEDGRELLKVLDGRKANADSMFLYKSAFPGSVVEVEDAVAECVKQMQIEIAPVQDLHGYGKPWVGGSGKNKLDSSTNTDGVLIGSSGNTYSDENGTVTDYIPVTANTTYTFSGKSGNATSMTRRIYGYKSDKSADSAVASRTESVAVGSAYKQTFTIASDSTIAYIRLSYAKSDTECQVEVGSSETSYEPYSNICPISGHTGCEIVRAGKNLFDGNFTDQRLINTSGTADENYYHKVGADYISVESATKYILSGNNLHDRASATQTNNAYVNVATYDSNKVFIERLFATTDDKEYYEFTTSANAKYIRFTVGLGASDVKIAVGNIYTIAFPSPTPGTVYGGTLTLNQDGTGTLVVDSLCLNLGELTWTDDTDYGRYRTDALPTVKFNDSARRLPFISDRYEAISDGRGLSTITNGQAYFGPSSGNMYLYVHDNSYSSVNDFVASVQNSKVIVEAKTSSTYTLTPDQVHLLLGYNTLYASTGSILSMLYPTSQVEAVANAKADGILETLSTPSEVMSFSDGADGIPMGVEVAIEPVQDLHGYDKPWVGGAGRNLLPNNITSSSAKGVSWTVSDDGIITLNGTATGEIYESLWFTTDSKLQAGEYKWRGFSENNKITFQICNKAENNAFVATKYNGHTFTVTSQMVGDMKIRLIIPNGTVLSNFVVQPIIVLSTDTDTSYEPYSNICPISGFDHAEVTRTGKNLFNGHRNDGYISDTGVEGTDNTNAHSDYIPVVVGKTYVYSWKTTSTSNVNRRIHGYDKNKNWVQMIEKNQTATSGNKAFTIPAGVAFIRVQFLVENHADAETEVQIEEGSTVTSYEPYSGNTYSITFPTSAGTVYGGTLTVNKDGSGVLVVDRATYELDQYEIHSIMPYSTQNFYAVRYNNMLNNTDLFSIAKKISSHYEFIPYAETGSATKIGQIQCVNKNAKALIISSNISTVEEWASYLAAQRAAGSPVTICIDLTTPVTYTIPAPVIRSLLGNNSLWSNTGDVLNLSYSADTKSYIDNLFSSITSAVGQTF